MSEQMPEPTNVPFDGSFATESVTRNALAEAISILQRLHDFDSWGDKGFNAREAYEAKEAGKAFLARTAASLPTATGDGLSGYVVGNAAGTQWRTWTPAGPAWTADREQAIRYARRIDAERAHEEDEDAWRIEPYASRFASVETSADRDIALARETLAGHPHGKEMPDLALAWLANRAELHARAVIKISSALADAQLEKNNPDSPKTDLLNPELSFSGDAIREEAAKALGLFRCPGGSSADNPPTRWPTDKRDRISGRNGTIPLDWDFAEKCRAEVDVVLNVLRSFPGMPPLEASLDAEALAGYRAAVSWIGADSWDGCSDCVSILKLAAAADYRRSMTPDEIADVLKRLRLHGDQHLGAHPKPSTITPSLS